MEICCSDYQTVDPDLEPIKWDLRAPGTDMTSGTTQPSHLPTRPFGNGPLQLRPPHPSSGRYRSVFAALWRSIFEQVRRYAEQECPMRAYFRFITAHFKIAQTSPPPADVVARARKERPTWARNAAWVDRHTWTLARADLRLGVTGRCLAPPCRGHARVRKDGVPRRIHQRGAPSQPTA